MCLKMWIGRFIRGCWGRLGEERWDLQIFLQITPLDVSILYYAICARWNKKEWEISTLQIIDKEFIRVVINHPIAHVFNVCWNTSSNVTKGTRYKRAPSLFNGFTDGLSATWACKIRSICFGQTQKNFLLHCWKMSKISPVLPCSGGAL